MFLKGHKITRTAGPRRRKEFEMVSDPKIDRRLADIEKDSPRNLKLFRRVLTGNVCRSMAIKAFCLECTGFDIEWVKTCDAKACPLFRVRPYRS